MCALCTYVHLFIQSLTMSQNAGTCHSTCKVRMKNAAKMLIVNTMMYICFRFDQQPYQLYSLVTYKDYLGHVWA